MTTSELAFTPATLTLRPPRVAIVFPDDDRWRDWVMHALEAASSHWGGAGFILVPHDEAGEPSPHFPEIVRTYDPDHIVTLEVPAGDFENWYPGSISIEGVESVDERAEILRNLTDAIPHAASERARDRVASWCSPLRSARLLDHQGLRPDESKTSIAARPDAGPFRRGLPIVPPLRTPVFAASSAWRTDIGLFSAALAGVMRDDAQPRPEPPADVIDWVVRREGAAPADLIYTPDSALNVHEVPTLFGAHPGIIQVSRRLVRDMAAVVIGDTGTDFALALAYDRILGHGYWITHAMLDDIGSLRHLRSSLWWVISQLHRQGAFLPVSSSSIDDAALAAASTTLQQTEHDFERFGLLRSRVAESDTVQLRLPRLDQGFMELIVDEHAGRSVVLPMTVMDDGTQESLTGLDTPAPSNLMHDVSSGQVPYWYVDVFFPQRAAPGGRDVPGSALLAVADGSFPEVTVRASKDGMSFNPSSLGFVSGRSLLPGRLGRPRLRSLSMRSWIAAMAEAAGLGTRLSTPGRQAELVSHRLGSRTALLELVSSPDLHVLRAFIRHTRVPRTREPGMTVIGLDPYLTFEKMNLFAGSEEATRDLVDRLSSARLLRRGLILGCEECGRVSFVDANQVGHEYECPQCAAPNLLTHARWREGNEPRWHYDLYTPFRDLLEKHGEVPLLAAAHLRSSSRSYSDAPELEFFDLDTQAAVAEIDLIASVDNKVVLVEAKISGAFTAKARGRQTAKMLRVAEALRADEIILATSKPEWNAVDFTHLSREAGKSHPFPMAASVLTGLGED